MNKLVLNSESLNNVLEGRTVSRDGLTCIYEGAMQEPSELLATAQELRKRYKGNRVTFSKKAFFNLVNLCRDTCSYCTYKAEPGEEKLSLLSVSNVRQIMQLARKYRCVEALFVTGEEPELRYDEARQWLRENGFNSTVEYLIHASEMALEYGLFPHTNAGNLRKKDMRELQKTNTSMGLMLESASERLCMEGMPHHLAASKRPGARLRVLEDAGELGIPMTTGLLAGIGETPAEMIDSIMEIKRLHEKHGNIQEVILQNFQPKQDTAMGSFPAADADYLRVIVSLTRIAMPEMNIQVPPNLSPGSYQDFISAGINDWGGISPLTPDYVNPEFPWPEINRIREHTGAAGFSLKCRFPVYPEFFSHTSKELRDKMAVIEDGGLVREDYWR